MKKSALGVLVLALGAGVGFLLRLALLDAPAACPPCRNALSACDQPDREAVHSRPAPELTADSKRAVEPGSGGRRTGLLEERDRLEAQVAVQEHLLAGAEADLHGVPIAWPDRPDPKYTREGMLAVVSQAIDQQDLPIDIVGVDCSEFPCMVALTTTAELADTDGLVAAEAWQNAFPGHFAIDYLKYFEQRSCGQGRSVRAVALAPFEADRASGNLDLRLQYRRMQLLEGSACGPPLASRP